MEAMLIILTNYPLVEVHESLSFTTLIWHPNLLKMAAKSDYHIPGEISCRLPWCIDILRQRHALPACPWRVVFINSELVWTWWDPSINGASKSFMTSCHGAMGDGLRAFNASLSACQKAEVLETVRQGRFSSGALFVRRLSLCIICLSAKILLCCALFCVFWFCFVLFFSPKVMWFQVV